MIPNKDIVNKVYKTLVFTFVYIVFIINGMESETLQITTYYPAPYGAYVSILTTGNTFLARDSGNVGIGTTTPSTKLDVIGDVKWGVQRGRLTLDQGASIELGGTGTPYIDFSNDPTTDYDVRFRLTGDDELRVEGGDLWLERNLWITNISGGFCTTVNYPNGTCPSGYPRAVGFLPSSASRRVSFYAIEAATLNFTLYSFTFNDAGLLICCRILY